MASPAEQSELTDSLALQITTFVNTRRVLEAKRRGSGMKWCLEFGIGGTRTALGITTHDTDPVDAATPINNRTRRILENACAACEIARCRLHDLKDAIA